jgi:hypothetical protein
VGAASSKKAKSRQRPSPSGQALSGQAPKRANKYREIINLQIYIFNIGDISGQTEKNIAPMALTRAQSAATIASKKARSHPA